MSAEQINNLNIEGRLVKQLSDLKKSLGPFTDPNEVNEFLQNSSISEKGKLKRMKMEAMYARDTSLSFPKSKFSLQHKNNESTWSEEQTIK